MCTHAPERMFRPSTENWMLKQLFFCFLKSLLYNAFRTSRCLAGYALLNCPAIQDYTTLKNHICAEAEDFSTFLYMIGTETVLADYEHAGI